MSNSQQEILSTEIEGEGGSPIENMLRAILVGYQDAWNKHNEDREIEYNVTITTHKVQLPDGDNKDVAYLRLQRAITVKDTPTKENEYTSPDVQLVHQELRPFKSMKERVDKRQLWKEDLIMACIARLVGAGLEYAELLQKMKRQKEEEEEAKPKLDLIITDQMPKALTEDEIKYAQWVKEQKEKEGL